LAARSLGQSMRILKKKKVHGLHEDEPESRPPGAQAAAQAPAEITAGASGYQPAQQAQIDALQQIRDLQRATTTDAALKPPAAAAAETSRPARQPIYPRLDPGHGQASRCHRGRLHRRHPRSARSARVADIAASTSSGAV